MKQTLTLLIFILVTACGNQPLAQPENDTVTESIKLTATSTVTPNIPLSPTASQTATPTVKPSITPSSTATKTPTPQVHFSFYTPAPTDTPTSTPTLIEVIQPEQLTNGYTFSNPRLVPNTLGNYIELIDWLPDDPHKILIVRGHKSIEVIDINTGETQVYSDGKDWIRHPVWLPARQAVAYMTSDENDYTKDYVWINDGEKSELVFTTAWSSPLAVTPDGNGLILFDANWQLTQVEALNPQAIKLATDTQQYTPPGYNHGELYQMVQSPDRQKALYFNDETVLLADFVTGSITPFDLTTLKTEGISPIKATFYATWDTSSTKVALNLSSGKYASRRETHLFILETHTNTLRFVEDNITWVGDLAWNPDSTHIMTYASAGMDENGYSIDILYLIDTVSGQVQIIDVLPNKVVFVGSQALLWSPFGNYIAVTLVEESRHPGLSTLAEESRHPGLYIIEVNNK